MPDAASVLCGDGEARGCDRVFHLACVSLRKPPSGDWFCRRDDCRSWEALRTKGGGGSSKPQQKRR